MTLSQNFRQHLLQFIPIRKVQVKHWPLKSFMILCLIYLKIVLGYGGHISLWSNKYCYERKQNKINDIVEKGEKYQSIFKTVILYRSKWQWVILWCAMGVNFVAFQQKVVFYICVYFAHIGEYFCDCQQLLDKIIVILTHHKCGLFNV